MNAVESPSYEPHFFSVASREVGGLTCEPARPWKRSRIADGCLREDKHNVDGTRHCRGSRRHHHCGEMRLEMREDLQLFNAGKSNGE